MRTARHPRSRPVRIAPFVLLLLVAACARPTAPVAEGSEITAPPATPTESVAATIAPDAEPGAPRTLSEVPSLSPFTGAPPVWDLDEDLTSRIRYDIDSIWGDRRNIEGLAEDCLDMHLPWQGAIVTSEDQGCLEDLLVGQGLDGRAFGLLWTTGLEVYSVEGSGPVWVASAIDWGRVGSNGSPIAAPIFTSDGVLELEDQAAWRAFVEATDAAKASEPFVRLVAAVDPDLRTPWGDPGPPPDFAQYPGDDQYVGTPSPSIAGWSVPLVLAIHGCHACPLPFAGRFLLDFTEEGSPSGMRFVDICALGRGPFPTFTNAGEVAAIAASVPECGVAAWSFRWP